MIARFAETKAKNAANTALKTDKTFNAAIATFRPGPTGWRSGSGLTGKGLEAAVGEIVIKISFKSYYNCKETKHKTTKLILLQNNQ